MDRGSLLRKIKDNVSEVTGCASFTEYAALILVKDLYRQARPKSAQKVIENYESVHGHSKALADLRAFFEDPVPKR